MCLDEIHPVGDLGLSEGIAPQLEVARLVVAPSRRLEVGGTLGVELEGRAGAGALDCTSQVSRREQRNANRAYIGICGNHGMSA